MQGYKIAFYITGIFGYMFSLLMLIPALVEYFTGGENLHVFLNSSYFGMFVSLLIIVTSYTKEGEISHRSSFIATTIIWLKITVISAIPLYFAKYPGYNISMIDALFESSSGITTTGASVLLNIDNISKGILLWRAMLQFFGGVGIITLVFIIIPYLQNGAMYFFLTESSENQGKETPRIIDFAILILLVYFIFTIICAFCYYIFGMPLFDAICSAMSTVSSGGFGTHDASFKEFSGTIQTVAIVFMVFSAMPFIMIVRLFTRRRIVVSMQALAMLYLFAVFSLITFLYYAMLKEQPFTLEHFRHIIFAVVSIGSSTGFASYDLSQYGGFLVNILLFVGFVGGCTGSTSGGVKVFRFQVIYQMLKFHFMRTVHQNIVSTIKTDGQGITQTVVTSIVVLFALYIIFAFISVFLITASGFSLTDALSISVSILSNGGMIASEYGASTSMMENIPQFARGVFIFLMILGRLEFVAVLVMIMQIFKRV